MKQSRIINYKVTLLFLVIPHFINAQNAKIKIDDLQIVDKKLEIRYSILKSKNAERFYIWFEVTDSKGKMTKIGTFYGDIRENQHGGKNKSIRWDYQADELSMSDLFSVQVRAKQSTVEWAVSPKNAFLKSMILPGWGLSSIDNKKPYWIMGAAGYGSIAGSIILYQNSRTDYEKYESSYDRADSDENYSKSESKASNSKKLAYAAVGIWVVSGVWTIIKANKINRSDEASNKRQKINFYAQHDPILKTSGIGVVYKL